MERKYITCDLKTCTGCGICEMVCSSEKEKSFCPELSRIHLVHLDEKEAVSIACRFCENTPCISACPRDALTMDEANNVIRLDKMRCTGCGWCIEACDFGAIVLDHATKSVVLCDLCEGRSQPKCVEICPKQALKIATLEIKAQQARAKAAKYLKPA
ncbi:MAG: 4Fe-4S dicluster domain-containing protein [Chloroflexi bacterium]|nr:4Fe-4S dicluster domain-containing protein [Chloroflexota bacterium]